MPSTMGFELVADGDGLRRRHQEGAQANPFWSQRAREEFELAQARPADHPSVANTLDLIDLEFDKEHTVGELPPVDDEFASEELEGGRWPGLHRGGLEAAAGGGVPQSVHVLGGLSGAAKQSLQVTSG